VAKLKVDETKFNECYSNSENNILVKKEFEQ